MMTDFLQGIVIRRFSDEKNPLSVRFLTVHNTDVIGPLTPGYMLIKSLLVEDDELIGVIACRRKVGEYERTDFGQCSRHHFFCGKWLVVLGHSGGTLENSCVLYYTKRKWKTGLF